MPWRQQARIYADRRILSVFLFGILSGLPWVMIGSALTLWLKESDISRTDIGYAGFIFSVYAINFLWAPLLDKYSLRLLPGIGKRRTWILLCQLVIIASCWGIGNFTPATDARAVVLVALLIAIASATQDVAIDAYRVDQFEPGEARQPHLGPQPQQVPPIPAGPTFVAGPTGSQPPVPVSGTTKPSRKARRMLRDR